MTNWPSMDWNRIINVAINVLNADTFEFAQYLCLYEFVPQTVGRRRQQQQSAEKKFLKQKGKSA